MEKHIHTLFNEDILASACSKFNMDGGSIKKVGGFENYVYGYTLDNKEYVLRLTHSSHRSIDMVQGELDWVHYLSNNHSAVCMPIYSKNHQLAEVIPITEDNYFIATSFEKSQGRHIQAKDANDSLFRTWGKAIGKMHQLTKNYKPQSTATTRPAWHEEKLFSNCREYLPEGHEIIADKLEDMIHKIKSLPQDKDGYGLIHTDIHSGNFFINNGEITVFDFDDCSYMYFISDIAIALFYCLLRPDTPENRLAFANRFLKAFLEGYREENQLDDYWIQLLPDFLKLRELELYVVVYRSCDMNNPGPWEENYMRNRKESIENDIPFLGLEWDLSPFMNHPASFV